MVRPRYSSTRQIGESLVGPERSRTVAHAVRQHEQAPQQHFIGREQLDRLLEPVHRGNHVSVGLGAIGESRGRLPGTSLEAPCLALLPTIEARRVTDEHASQELTAVEPQSLLELAAFEALLELDGVAGEAIAGRPR